MPSDVRLVQLHINRRERVRVALAQFQRRVVLAPIAEAERDEGDRETDERPDVDSGRLRVASREAEEADQVEAAMGADVAARGTQE